MPPFWKYLPKHSNDWIRDFSLSTSDGKCFEIGAGAFKGKVRLVFEDGSNAFIIEDEAREELAVFTEHCGYQIFRSSGVRAEYLVWTEPRHTLADSYE